MLHLGDCMDVMRKMPDNSVDLILTDPPYFKVKGDWWDNQWSKPAQFLEWLDGVLSEFQRILKPNGSLYLFASPQMAARVEVLIGKRFNVLNSIRWVKDAGWHKKTRKEDLRSYLSPWEACIFAEHPGSDNIAKGEAGYAAKCDELRGFVFEPLRAYLAAEIKRAGWTPGRLNEAMGFAPRGMAETRYFGQSQWQLPTEPHYLRMRQIINAGAGNEYLRRDYEDLRRDYEDLRRDYEDLREEYEELRRPFAVTAEVPHTDIWSFAPVSSYPGKHPCEKPAAMLEHIITASSRPGAIVFDAFAGSGATAIAALKLDRQFIGCEMSAEHHAKAAQRIQERLAPEPQADLFAA